MSQGQTSKDRAMRLLALVRERTEHTHEPVFVNQLAGACQLSTSEAEAAWRYLHDLDLIATFSVPYTARINAKGIEALDSGTQKRSEETADGVRGYGRVDSQEALDRAREVSKELHRLHAFLPHLTDVELSAYSTKSLPIGTFLQSKGQTFSVLTEDMLANAFKEEANRRAVQTKRPDEQKLTEGKRSRMEVASWIAGIVVAVAAVVGLIVEFLPKRHEAGMPKESVAGNWQTQVSGTQIGQTNGPVTIYNAPPVNPTRVEMRAPGLSNPPPRICTGENTLTFAPSDPGVMQTDPAGRRIDLGDGGGGTRLQEWMIRWTAPAKVTSVHCSGQRNEHVLAENKNGSLAECIGSINGGNDALSMHVTWVVPCDAGEQDRQ